MKLSTLSDFLGPPLTKYTANQLTGTEVLKAILSTGMLQPSLDETVRSKKIHKIFDMERDLRGYASKVHRKVFNVQGDMRHKQFMSSRLQLNPQGDLDLISYVYQPVFEKETSRTRALIETRSSLFESPSDMTRLFDFTSRRKPITNFSGDIFRKEDGRNYDQRIEQYASSSFEKSKMSPFMVAYPYTVKDISLALAFAKANNKKVVARSGGCHYTGKSSGGQDTIVLSMENFNILKKFTEENVPIKEGVSLSNSKRNLLEIGPGVTLTNLARQLDIWDVTIPHGECPYVGIGGHAQTGGYGHLARSFGLALDYVEAFEIVLADGTFLTVHRGDPEGSMKKDLFRSVLGGNPGSFGIVTKYIMRGIRDTDHPNSYWFSQRRSYKSIVFKALMKEVQKWTQAIQEDKDSGTLYDGADFMMTVRSSQSVFGLPILPALMLIEPVYSDITGETPYNDQFKSIVEIAKDNWSFSDYLPYYKEEKGLKGLSEMSDSFVRRVPATTPSGREFKYPYKKRINVTMKELSDDFVEKFCQKIDDVVTQEKDKVKLIFQMVLGGGQHKRTQNRAHTSLPHRDMTFKFVFDLFYTPGNENRAIQLQEEMQAIVNENFHHDGQERRVFWGSFGNVNMNDSSVRKMYYETEEDYQKLQKFKTLIDPNDLFHTEFTVQLPESH